MTISPRPRVSGIRHLAAALLILVIATACTSDPIIDTKGVDSARYQADLAECRQYADRVSVAGNAAGGGLLGGAAGAAVGAAVGAVTGNPGASGK